MSAARPAQTAEELRALFDAPAAATVGIEEEVMLLHPGTLGLAPLADEVIARAGDPRVKGELPRAQVEGVSAPAPTVAAAATELAEVRRAIAAAAAPAAVPAASGLHPLASAVGELGEGERYRFTRSEYAPVAPRQMVSGLHVHVRVNGADRAVAVYNGIRSRLPEIAALAANAPFSAGLDTGFASYRPVVNDLLPRQGVPPALAGVEDLAAQLAWGLRSGALPEARMWWWELRLHPAYGTVEVRVADQQTTVAQSAAVAAVVHSLAAELGEAFDRGEEPPAHPGWRIAQNRWSAARHGLAGTLADLEGGEPAPARERVLALIDSLGPAADRLGCSAELAGAEALARENGSELQRAFAGEHGLRELARWLASRFLE